MKQLQLAPEQKQVCTEMFEVLGPERVEKAVRSRSDNTWAGCFIARAWGRKGELEMLADSTQQAQNCGAYVAQQFGIDEDFLSNFIDIFDGEFHLDMPNGKLVYADEKQTASAVRRLAREWLELQPKRDQHDPRRDQTVEAAGADRQSNRRPERSADVARERLVEAG